MSSLLDETISGLAADATSCTDDRDDLACHLLLGGHALELGLFKEPILDIKSLLLRQRDILVHGFGTAHDLHGAVVELGGHAALALVLAPGNHAQSGNEDDGGVRIAHGGRVVAFAGVVIGGVVLAVLLDPLGEKRAQTLEISRLRIPIHIEGLDLGAEEMVGAAGAQLGETRCVGAVHESQDSLILLDRADEALLLADLAAEPWKDRNPEFTALCRIEALILGSSEGLVTLVLIGDVLGGSVNQVDGEVVALFLRVGPVDKAVLTHDDSLGIRVLLANLLEL